jgi:hypothetical protein
MSTDFAAKERAFIDALAADTGRDLAAWMEAISASGHAARNDIIDWLRQQGFTFARASWLERIHHNGGKPIYADAVPRAPATRREAAVPPISALAERAGIAAGGEDAEAPAAVPPATAPPPPPPAAAMAPAAIAATPAARPAASQTPAPTAVEGGSADLAALLARAKAYRPLAAHLLAEIARRLPDTAFEPREGYVAMLAPAEFAVLGIGPKELKLGLALASRSAAPPLRKAKLVGVGPHVTHMIALTDARQVNGELLALVVEAKASING